MSEHLDTLEELIGQLNEAAAALRAGELEPDQAAALVEECARLASQAGSELDKAQRDVGPDPHPGQDSLL